jgi:adenosylhomocysteine nucleosidase
VTILIATGMKSEAKVLARDGVIVATAGTDHARLEAELEAGVAAGATAILSMGLAGALAPRLRVGDWVVGTISPTGMARREWSIGAGAARPRDAKPEPHPIAQKDASRGWITRIAAVLPGAVVGRIHADGTMVVTPAQKEQYHFSERALACDMESHIAAKVARRHNLPFAVARVISDEADRPIPRAAQVAMAPDGGVRMGAVLLAILRRPWQLFALIALALATASAMKALANGYRLLAEDQFGHPAA